VLVAQRKLDALNALRQQAERIGQGLGDTTGELGQALIDLFSNKSTRDAADGQLRSRKQGISPTRIGEKVRDAGGVTMGQRSVPTRADLGAAPEPEFSVSAGNPVPKSSPAIRSPQELREQIERAKSAQRLIRESAGSPKPESITATDYLVQNLGLRQPPGSEAIAEFTTSTGRIRPAGTKVGGQFYNPATMASEGNLDVIRRSGATTVADLNDLPDAPARISQGQKEMFIAPGEVRMKQGPEGPMLGPKMNVVDDMRPRGVQLVDFKKLTEKLSSVSPSEKAAVLATLGLTGGGLIVGNMLRGERPMTQESSEAPDAGEYMGGGGSLPEALTPEQSGALAADLENKLAATQQSDPVAGSVMRAMAPKSPEQYANINDYYADRARFVRALQPREEGSEFQAVVDAIKTTAANEEMAGNLAAFARANPQMAYENMLRQGLINREGQMVSPEMNQQSQSVTSPTFGSSLGTNNEANALGQANAAASQMYTGDFNNDLEAAAAIQKNNELIAAAAPIEYGNLQRAEDFLGQQLAARMAYRMGGVGQ